MKNVTHYLIQLTSPTFTYYVKRFEKVPGRRHYFTFTNSYQSGAKQALGAHRYMSLVEARKDAQYLRREAKKPRASLASFTISVVEVTSTFTEV